MKDVGKARRLLYHASAALVSVFLVSPVFIMTVDRADPVVLTSGVIEPRQVRSGEDVTVTWVVEERRSCEGELRRLIIDSTGKRFEYEPEKTVYHDISVKFGPSFKTFSKTFKTPQGMALGEATYYPVLHRWCNPLQKYVWPIVSKRIAIKFEVVK